MSKLHSGKLEQLVIGNSAEIPSPTNARSFKDTFQIHDSYIFICNDSHRGSYCRHSSTLLLPAPSLPLLACLPVSPVLPLLHGLTFTLKIWLLRPPPPWCGDFFFLDPHNIVAFVFNSLFYVNQTKYVICTNHELQAANEDK